MKNLPKTNIKELARDFDEEFNTSIPIKILRDKSIIYKDFLIKLNSNNNWILYDTFTKSVLAEFFLKTCALLAAYEYNSHHFDRYQYIKHLDRRYQSHYSDIIVYKHNIKLVQDFDHRSILANKLDECQIKACQYQKQISRMFKLNFCINN